MKRQLKKNRMQLNDGIFLQNDGRKNRRFFFRAVWHCRDRYDICCSSVAVEKLRNTVFHEKSKEYDTDILGFSVCNIIEEILQEKGNGIACTENNQNYLIFFSCDGKGHEMFLEKKCSEVLYTVMGKIEEYLKLSSAIGLSKSYSALENVKQAFSQSAQALESVYYGGYGKLYLYSDTNFSEELNLMYGELQKTFTLAREENMLKEPLENFLEYVGREKLRPDLMRKLEDYISTNLLSFSIN